MGGGGASPGYCTTSLGSHLATRPTTTAYGTSVTCYQNAFTAYTAVGSALSEAVSEIELRFTDGQNGASAKSTVVRVGIDLAGGTSFTAVGDFLIGPSPINTLGGSKTSIWLPYAIPSGARIGVVGSVNNAAPGTLRCSWRASGGARGTMFSGAAIESVGLTLASSTGTAVTPGDAAEGSWTLLGTLTNAAKYVGCGVSVDNATMATLLYHVDLSYSTDGGTTKTLLVEDMPVWTTTSESVGFDSVGKYLALQSVPANAGIYGRAQCSGTPDAGFSMAAWAVR